MLAMSATKLSYDKNSYYSDLPIMFALVAFLKKKSKSRLGKKYEKNSIECYTIFQQGATFSIGPLR